MSTARIALVTGGAGGLGYTICTKLDEKGYRVVLTHSPGNTTIKETLAELKSKGHDFTAYPVDVADYDSCQRCVAQVQKDIGPIDILINNAGVAHVGKADNTAEEDFDRVIGVNVKGAYNCLHAAIPLLKENGGGVILNMASVAAWVAVPERFAYSTAKGAVMAMTLSVAKDYLQDGIRCNSISPGRVHTPFVDGFLAKNYPGREAEMFERLSKTQPIGRMARPEEVAALALYLCSDEAAFITGSDYPIDGGFITLNA
jgi:NAD(P)-dependent dehydrogenase (short-subunit alcohol dehydrogenase family)